jgi:hypothetical protein
LHSEVIGSRCRLVRVGVTCGDLGVAEVDAGIEHA